MILEMAKEQIRMHQMIGEKKDIFHIEDDVIVNDVKPDVLRIINTNGTICVNKKEVIDGKIKVEGEINTYIIYLADDESGSIRSLNACLDFAELLEVPSLTNGVKAEVNLKIKNLETKVINGRKVNVKVFIEAQTKLYTDGENEIIDNIDELEDIEVLKTNEKILSLLGEGSTKASAKDTISIDDADEIAEIMKVDFKMAEQEVKTSYNKVLVKTDAKIEIMYLTEDNRINSVNASIPVMGFIDMPNVDEDCICTVSNDLRSLVIKPNNGEEHSIYIESEIEFSIETYETKDVDIIEDLYSIDKKIEFKSKKINAITSKEKIKENYSVKENIEISELKDGKICSTTIMPNILKEDIKNGKVLYEGEVNIEILYTANGSLDTKNISIPFNFEITSNAIKETSKIMTDINVINDNFIVLPNGTLDIEMDLEFDLQVEENKELNVIEEITEEEYKDSDQYSMVIYFVKQGDTLWKIAKKFRSRVEDIAKINDIEDEAKLQVGEQLYIPKLMKCNG